jgi:FlaA1/EpsC-like NDP-sugar epimerase
MAGYLVTDLALINLALWLARALCNTIDHGSVPQSLAATMSSVISVVGGLLLLARNIYLNQPRYFGLFDVYNITTVWALVAGSSAVVATLVAPDGQASEAFAYAIVFSLILIPFLAIPRVVRMLMAVSPGRGWKRRGGKALTRTLVVGAGDAGEIVTRENKRSPNVQRSVVALVDDDPDKRGTHIHGVPIVGDTASIPHFVEKLGIQEIVVAIPSASGEAMRRIVEICGQTSAKVLTLPETAGLAGYRPQLSQRLREVRVEDLLRRAPVTLNEKTLSDSLRSSRVLITGAGGSIGSELARQIAHMRPEALVLLGHGENSIYEVEQEIVGTIGYECQCAIVDVRDAKRMDEVFARYRPDIVFHAAAHKHVPLMEANPTEAVRNNILGTRITAELAVRHGVRKFVYVSTDKAVKPCNVMGATKRVGEMIIATLADTSDTDFAIVRFGNVLGSRGSLIPNLESQIKRGGPIRITDARMTRFFMTIPEAALLILQASTFGSRSEVFILDMGEPVRIIDLAHDLIRLHGLEPGKDIHIEITGARPGEKLDEELVYPEEQLLPTPHPQISVVARSHDLPLEWIRAEAQELVAYCEDGDPVEVRRRLLDLANGTFKQAVIEAETSEQPVR